MRANIKIATKEAVFEAGTVGGMWAWNMVETDGLGGPTPKTAVEPVIWTTEEPYTSAPVEPGLTYKVCGQRLDVNKEHLGEAVCTSFSTEEEPSQVIIAVAGSISVEVV